MFVENRLRHLVATGEAESTVLAPVPWFPGRGVARAAVPPRETRHGLPVLHPRFLAVPKLGLLSNPLALYRTALAAIREGGLAFDAIDAHYLYPDGVAAAWLADALGKPLALTARGSDTSQLPRYPVAGARIRRAIARADALIAVSAGLAEGLFALGAPREKVTVLRNGVDLELFRPPADRDAARAALGLGAAPVLLSVGHLIERKGHDIVIEALASLPGLELVILGEGPERAALEALIRARGLADRVRLAGARPHAELPRWYGAADALVLASSREGWANVLLEAMACGTPVVATNAWGSREAVAAPEAGIVVGERSAAALADGIRRLLDAAPARAATRRYAEGFSWKETTMGQLRIFRRLVGIPA